MTAFRPPPIWLGLTIVVILTACGQPAPSPDPSADAVILSYTCGTFEFAPDLLPVESQQGDLAGGPPAVAFANYLQGPDRLNPRLPMTGWRLLGADDTRAEYMSRSGDGTVWDAIVQKGPRGWVVASPDFCQPWLVLPAGLERADWAFDPTQPAPGPATQVFDALVTERGCNSGQPADGRIVGPQIVRVGASVVVIFAVRPRGGGQDCQGNPPTRVTIDLGEPLGPRKLRDGGFLPFGDPAAPA